MDVNSQLLPLMSQWLDKKSHESPYADSLLEFPTALGGFKGEGDAALTGFETTPFFLTWTPRSPPPSKPDSTTNPNAEEFKGAPISVHAEESKDSAQSQALIEM